LTHLSFASFIAPYNRVRVMVPKIRLLHKNGNSSEHFYGHEKAIIIVLIGFNKHY